MNNLQDFVELKPNANGQAKIDSFCSRCDHHQDPSRRCLNRSHPELANTQMAYLLTDQDRYVLLYGDCSIARVKGVFGGLDEKEFHPSPLNVHSVSQVIEEPTSVSNLD